MRQVFSGCQIRLRGVDAAVTQSDVFEYFRTQRKTPNLERCVQYVIRMPISETAHSGTQ
jgi:hypothetical protein